MGGLIIVVVVGVQEVSDGYNREINFNIGDSAHLAGGGGIAVNISEAGEGTGQLVH